VQRGDEVITFLFALSLACTPADMPPDTVIQEALRGNLPMDTRTRHLIFGSVPDLPLATTPSKDGTVSYAVLVDPMFDHDCFERLVDSVLSDDRSWPGMRPAEPLEIPQVWIRLMPPALACGGVELFAHHCAVTRSQEGQGETRINYTRWHRSYDETTVKDSQTLIINHEVGHVLGFGHRQCSVMGGPGFGEWADCPLIVWPSEAERLERLNEGIAHTGDHDIEIKAVVGARP
jgi:hypothetical protein